MKEVNLDEAKQMTQAIFYGAGESVDVLTPADLAFSGVYDSLDTTYIIGSHIRFTPGPVPTRCILISQDYLKNVPRFDEIYYKERQRFSIEIFRQFGWDVRLYNQLPQYSGFIVDRKSALIFKLSWDTYKPAAAYLCENRSEVKDFQNHFDKLWSMAVPIAVIYEDSQYLSSFESNSQIVVASEETWSEIIASLTRNPERLYSLSSRKFEELIAELLIRDGMKVQLTPPSNDGGRDILALSETQAGQHLYLVECKRYSVDNPVGVSIVRALYGVVEAERATAGLLVTTSYFTKGALSFRDSVKYKLSMKDYGNLVDWLKKSVR
jgi:HJR/Mrr/RecB family endonuclease